MYPAPLCGEEDSRPIVLASVHYTYFGALSMIICSVVIVVVSLFTEIDSSIDVSLTATCQRYVYVSITINLQEICFSSC